MSQHLHPSKVKIRFVQRWHQCERRGRMPMRLFLPMTLSNTGRVDLTRPPEMSENLAREMSHHAPLKLPAVSDPSMPMSNTGRADLTRPPEMWENLPREMSHHAPLKLPAVSDLSMPMSNTGRVDLTALAEFLKHENTSNI